MRPAAPEEPVWAGYFADPFALRVGDAFYAYGTDGPGDPVYRETGRRFPVLRSDDLVRWQPIGGALVPPPGTEDHAFWAPAVAEQDGRFYLYYSSGGPEGEGHAIRVAIADRPEGPFEPRGGPLMPQEPFTIDADPFRDPRDGRRYLFFCKDFFDDPAGTGIAVAPLADDLESLAGEPVPVLRGGEDWHVYEHDRPWYGRVWPRWHTAEGPCAVFHEGRVYLLYSGGLWKRESYGVGFAVADHPLGPFAEPHQGPVVLSGAGTGLVGPGHNSVVTGPDGRERIVYHAWDAQLTARRMHVSPLVWTPDGPRGGDRR
jgi:GH43 family beta-xylosidase